MRRGLAPTRQEAQAAIAAGTVLVAGAPAEKPARLVAPDDPVVVLGPPSRFVGRAGQKLDAALDRFAVPVTGRHALDAGASTGGFTDCLLQRDAARVYAVDVGHGQLDPRLRADPRVVVLEHTNIRTMTAIELRAAEPAYEAVPLVVADLSFISLRTVVPTLCGPSRRPTPTWSSWSSRSSKSVGPPSPGAGAWCVTPLCGSARWRGLRPRSLPPEPASWGRWLPP